MKLSEDEIDLLADGLDLVLSSTMKELDSMRDFKVKLDKIKLIKELVFKLQVELESK